LKMMTEYWLSMETRMQWKHDKIWTP